MPVKKPANPHFHKVTYSKHHLVLRDVRVQTNADGLLIVDIELHNLLGSGAAYQYRVFWKTMYGKLLLLSLPYGPAGTCYGSKW